MTNKNQQAENTSNKVDKELHVETENKEEEFPKERIVVINNVRYKCVRQDGDKDDEEVPCPEKIKQLQQEQREQEQTEDNNQTNTSTQLESQQQNQVDKTSSQISSRAESPELSVTVEYEIVIQSESSNTATQEKKSESQSTSRAETPSNAEQHDRHDDSQYHQDAKDRTGQEEGSLKSQKSRPDSPELRDYSERTQYDTENSISKKRSSESDSITQKTLVDDTRNLNELHKSSSSSSNRLEKSSSSRSNHSETYFSNERRKSKSDSNKFENYRSDDERFQSSVEQIISDLSFPEDPNKQRSKFDSNKQDFSPYNPYLKVNSDQSNIQALIPNLDNALSNLYQPTAPQKQSSLHNETSRTQSQPGHDHRRANDGDKQGFSPSFSRTESEKNKTPDINDLIPEIEKILSQMEKQKQEQNPNQHYSTISQGLENLNQRPRDSNFSYSSHSHSTTESEKIKTPDINDLIPEIEKILSQMEKQRQEQNNNQHYSTISQELDNKNQRPRDSTFSGSYSSNSKSLKGQQMTKEQQYFPHAHSNEHHGFGDEAAFSSIGQNRPSNQRILTEKDFLPSPRPDSENKNAIPNIESLIPDIERALNKLNMQFRNQGNNQYDSYKYPQQSELNEINLNNQSQRRILTDQDFLPSPNRPSSENKNVIPDIESLIPDIEKALKQLNNMQTKERTHFDSPNYADQRDGSSIRGNNEINQAQRRILTEKDFLPSPRPDSENKNAIPNIESLIPDIERALNKLNMQFNNKENDRSDSGKYYQHRDEPELIAIDENRQAQRRILTDQDFLPSPNRPSSENKNAIPDIESLIPGIEKALEKLDQSHFIPQAKPDHVSFNLNNDPINSHQQNKPIDQETHSEGSRTSSRIRNISNIDQELIPNIIQSFGSNPISGVFAVPGRYSGFDSSANDQNQENQKYTPLSVYDKLMTDPRFYTQSVCCADKDPQTYVPIPDPIPTPIPIPVEPKPFIHHEPRKCQYVLTRVSKHVIRTVRKEIICK